eukprot:TRINITY_DN1269_c0_g1_i1.p1 TRINITY_DN1269_c0_g1~~TRINITY_DN1269_c0_g1_i1.p1  ORF type:complete len:205 (-),score=34.29 TRINITY_DN1269_c0_g1_i1:67-681(-)
MAKVDVKVILLGMHSVGKTSLVDRFMHERYKEKVTATVGAAFGCKKIMVGGKSLTLGVWDTAGAERFESMGSLYYRDAQAALVCHDLSHPESWNKVLFWVNEIQANEKGCHVYIVGTKADICTGEIKRSPSAEKVASFADSVGAKVFITSAKTGEGTTELFRSIAEDFVIRDSVKDLSPLDDDDTLDITGGAPPAQPKSWWQAC